jgi:hypothetical protein
MTHAEDLGSNTAPIRLTVSNARAIDAKILFALVDVEVVIADIAFDVLGIQARRLPEGGTSVHPAIRLPEEVRGPLADAVLVFLVEERLARQKFTSTLPTGST